MPTIAKLIFGALAASLTLGAIQFASGQDLAQFASGQDLAGRFDALTDPAGADINRAAKADRAAGIPAAATPTRTILFKLESLADTSVLLRVPVAKEARNVAPTPAAPAPAATKPAERKPERNRMAVACEPTVSVLTEVAKLLQPGRCVT
jgi:hypothetical protein